MSKHVPLADSFQLSEPVKSPRVIDFENSEEFFDSCGVKPVDAYDAIGWFYAAITLGCIVWFCAIGAAVVWAWLR